MKVNTHAPRPSWQDVESGNVEMATMKSKLAKALEARVDLEVLREKMEVRVIRYYLFSLCARVLVSIV